MNTNFAIQEKTSGQYYNTLMPNCFGDKHTAEIYYTSSEAMKALEKLKRSVDYDVEKSYTICTKDGRSMYCTAKKGSGSMKTYQPLTLEIVKLELVNEHIQRKTGT